MLVVIGDRLEDFCPSYNLNRLRGRVCWLPHGLIDTVTTDEEPNGSRNGGSSETNMDWQLALAVAATAQGAAVQTTSFSLDEVALEAATETLVGFSLFRCQILPDGIVPLPYLRQLYCRDTIGCRYRGMFPDEESVNPVNAPLLTDLTDVPPTGLYWITDVGIEGYRLPARPEFGPSTLVCPLMAQARSASRGAGSPTCARTLCISAGTLKTCSSGHGSGSWSRWTSSNICSTLSDRAKITGYFAFG